MNIYLGRLSRNVSESKIKELFEQFGPVSSIKIIKDKFTGSPKGFAFVEMENQSDADQAISKLNNSNLEGRQIVVNPSRPREQNAAPRKRGGW